MPRNKYSSGLVEGSCIFLIATTFLGSGFTSHAVYVSPKKLQDFHFTMHLSKFSLIPAFVVLSIASYRL